MVKRKRRVRKTRRRVMITGGADPLSLHRVRIAMHRLQMSDEMARMMGGMTKAEAREVFRYYGLKESLAGATRRTT